MFGVDARDVFVITSDEDVATVDYVVKETTCFMCSTKFLFADRILELSFVEFAGECADYLFSTSWVSIAPIAYFCEASG